MDHVLWANPTNSTFYCVDCWQNNLNPLVTLSAVVFGNCVEHDVLVWCNGCRMFESVELWADHHLKGGN